MTKQAESTENRENEAPRVAFLDATNINLDGTCTLPVDHQVTQPKRQKDGE